MPYNFPTSIKKKARSEHDSLYIVCQNEEYNFASLLIDQGVAIGEYTYNINVEPILKEEDKFFEIANLILKLFSKCADITLNNNNKILGNWHVSIIQKQKVRLLEHMAKYGSNVVSEGEYVYLPLVEVAAIGNIKVGELLIDGTVNLNQKNKDGDTALHAACKSGHTSFVKFLVDHSSHVNVTDSYGRTPIAVAVEGCHTDTINFLITCGADLNYSPKKEWWFTPLGISLMKKNLEIAHLLVNEGADIYYNGKLIIDGLLTTNIDAYNHFMTICIVSKTLFNHKISDEESKFKFSEFFKEDLVVNHISHLNLLVKNSAKVLGSIIDILLSDHQCILERIIEFLSLSEMRALIYYATTLEPCNEAQLLQLGESIQDEFDDL